MTLFAGFEPRRRLLPNGLYVIALRGALDCEPAPVQVRPRERLERRRRLALGGQLDKRESPVRAVKLLRQAARFERAEGVEELLNVAFRGLERHVANDDLRRARALGNLILILIVAAAAAAAAAA